MTNQLEVQWPAYAQIELELGELRCRLLALTQTSNGKAWREKGGNMAELQECGNCAFVTKQACTVVPYFEQPLTVSQTHCMSYTPLAQLRRPETISI
jgi:hypothetical protein